MIILSLNVNGLKSAIDKGLKSKLDSINADIICLQETKCQDELLNINGYYSYYNYCNKKGYSGTCVFSKIKPVNVHYDFDNSEFDTEGRIITLEYKDFYLINVYVPNSKSGLSRIDYRMMWDELFREYVFELENKKPVIVCGDFNVALYSEDSNLNKEFIDNEKDEFYYLLENGFADAFRYINPNSKDCFTWWQVGKNSKEKNIGCRLDYFIVSDYLLNSVKDCLILKEVDCSDHSPILLEMMK